MFAHYLDLQSTDTDVHAGISLGAQLGVSAGLVIVLILIHAAGILAATKFLRLKDDLLLRHAINARAFGLLIVIALWLFGLHVIEIAIYALFYYWGAGMDFESALFFSTSAYTTLGQPTSLPDNWRLVGAFEGLIGFLLIGWSTAVFITDMSKLLLSPPGDEGDGASRPR